MWYALYCPEMNIGKFLTFCKNESDSGYLTDAFVFTCERMRRYEGAWHLETVPMFPDYVFFEGEDSREIDRMLKQCPSLSQGGGISGEPIPVQRRAQRLLQELCGPSHHMPMSRGVIVRGQTHVTEGPLKGREQMIRRIDRHKRLAFLDGMVLAGQQMKAGLEITEKTV